MAAVAWAIVVVGGLTLVGVAFGPGTATEGVADPVGHRRAGWATSSAASSTLGSAVLLVTVALSVLSLLPRFRRARGVERQQLKWLAYAAGLAAAFIAATWSAW